MNQNNSQLLFHSSDYKCVKLVRLHKSRSYKSGIFNRLIVYSRNCLFLLKMIYPLASWNNDPGASNRGDDLRLIFPGMAMRSRIDEIK